MLIIFQILFILFALAAAGSVVHRARRGELSFWQTFSWVVLWLGAGVLVAWPDGASMLARMFGIGRGADLVVYVSLAALFALIFRLHVTLTAVGRGIKNGVRPHEHSYIPKKK